tara:strand:+ start:236 stop:448 length:213 start_codon:yes stop_codon:yes gene_type:complete
MKRDRILQSWKALPMAEIKATCTCIEGIVFDSQTMLQSNEKIAQWHVLARIATRIYMASMLETSSGYKDW